LFIYYVYVVSHRSAEARIVSYNFKTGDVVWDGVLGGKEPT